MQYYVGVDIAKHTHFASIISSSGELILEAFKFENTHIGFKSLLAKLKDLNTTKILIGLESTAHYGNNFIRYFFNLGFNVGIINPIQTSSLRKVNIRKTKNDKIDSILICKCLMLGKFNLFTKQDLDTLTLKTLATERKVLLKSRSRAKIQLVALLDIVFPELADFFKGNLHLNVSYNLLKLYQLQSQIKDVNLTKLSNLLINNSQGRYKKQDAINLKKLAENSIGTNDNYYCNIIKQKVELIEYLTNQINCLEIQFKEIIDSLNSPIMTIPGMSYIQACSILGVIGNINRFERPPQIIAYAGLDPSVYQSGEFTAKNTKMSKRGSRLLREALVWSAFNVCKYNTTLNNYYLDKRSKGLSHYAALGHVATKLTRIIFKLLKENISFNLD